MNESLSLTWGMNKAFPHWSGLQSCLEVEAQLMKTHEQPLILGFNCALFCFDQNQVVLLRVCSWTKHERCRRQVEYTPCQFSDFSGRVNLSKKISDSRTAVYPRFQLRAVLFWPKSSRSAQSLLLAKTRKMSKTGWRCSVSILRFFWAAHLLQENSDARTAVHPRFQLRAVLFWPK